MSRLRIRLAKSEIDRKVASALDQAERILLSALRDTDRYIHEVNDPSEAARAKGVLRDLKKTLAAMGDVRRIHPLYMEGPEPVQETKPSPPTQG